MNKKITKEAIFKSLENSYILTEREYEILDTDGFFTRAIPKNIVNTIVCGDGTHIEEVSTGKNLGKTINITVQFTDSEYNFYPEGKYNYLLEDLKIVRDKHIRKHHERNK